MTYLCQTNSGMPALTSAAGSLNAVVAAALSNPSSKASTSVTLTVASGIATVNHVGHGLYDANSVELHSFSQSDLNGEKTVRVVTDGYCFTTTAPNGTYSGSVRTATPAWSYGVIDTNVFWIRPNAASLNHPYWVFDDRSIWHTTVWACPSLPTKFDVHGDARWPRASARQCAIAKSMASGGTDTQYKLIFREKSWLFDIITNTSSTWYFNSYYGVEYAPFSEYATHPAMLSGWFAGTRPDVGLYNDTMGEAATAQSQWLTYDQPTKAWFAVNRYLWDSSIQTSEPSASGTSGDSYLVGDFDQVVATPYGVGLGDVGNGFLVGYHDAVLFLPYIYAQDAKPAINAVTSLTNQQTGEIKLAVCVPVGSTSSNRFRLLTL